MQKPIPSRLSLSSLVPTVGNHSFENGREPENRFLADATGIALVNAWWLAELSLLAYRTPAEIKNELQDKTDLRLVGTLNGPVAQGFVAKGDGFAVVAFRGTEVPLPIRDRRAAFSSALRDVLADIQFKLVPAPAPGRGRVHQGFLDALDDVFGALEESVAVVRQAMPDCKLWLTGHSLGGALAILAAMRLSGTQRIQGVYVYGAPRVGDAEFVAGLKSLSLRPVRFIHGNDIVAQVPIDGVAPTGLGRFAPDGEAVSFDRQGRLHGGAMAAMSTGIGRLRARVERLFDRIPQVDLIDHAPIFYAIHVWNLFDRSR